MKIQQVPPVGLVTFYASRMECWIIWMNWRLLFEGNNDSLSASAVPEEAEEYLVACLNGIIIVVIVVKLSGSREKENSFETTTKKKKNRRRRGVCTAPWRPAVGVKPRFCCFSPEKMLILFFNIYFLFFLRRICLNLNELFLKIFRNEWLKFKLNLIGNFCVLTLADRPAHSNFLAGRERERGMAGHEDKWDNVEEMRGFDAVLVGRWARQEMKHAQPLFE